MGIIEDYIATADKPATTVQSGGLIDQYLKADTAAPKVIVKLSGPPSPPIAALEDERAGVPMNAKDNSIPQTSDKFPLRPDVVIPNIASDIYNQGKEGILNVAGGIGNRNLKQAGIGALQAVTAIPGGIAQGGVVEPVTQLSGSPDIGERAGFVASSAIPILPGSGALAGIPTSGAGLIKGATNSLPKNAALRTLIENIGPKDLPRVVSEMRANPSLGPADLSPRVLQDTQHLFANDGPQINYLKDTSDARMAAAKGQVENAYDAASGLPVNAVNKLKDLSDAAKKVGTSQINPAIAGAKPVDLAPVIEHIDNVLKPGVMKVVSGESTLPFPKVKEALQSVKDMVANESEQLTSPQALHDFQSALRRDAEARLKSGDGGQRQLGYALMSVRNKIVDAIDAASPKVEGKGTYKPALSAYRDEKDISNAFTDSYNGVLSNSKKMENRPEFTKQWVDSLTAQEKEAAKEGIRTRIDTEINSARNGQLAGTNLMQSEFNKQKMEMLVGKDEADALLQKLDAVRKITNTHNKVVEGSQTAMRTASKSQFTLPTKTQAGTALLPTAVAEGANVLSGGPLGLGTALLGAAKVADVTKDAIRTKLAKEHNLQYAKYALPTEGPSRDALINSLSAAIPGPKQSIVRRSVGTLSRLVGP